MAKREWVVNAVLLLIGLVFTVESWRLGIGNIHLPGKGFLPCITGGLLVLIAFFSLLTNYLALRKAGRADGAHFFSRSVLKAVAVIGALILYTLVLPWLGYLISTLLLMTSLFRLGGFHKWPVVVAVSLLTTAISYILFSVWLHIRFPTGIF